MKKCGCVNCKNFAKFCAEENNVDNPILYTVTVTDRLDPDTMPLVSVFTTRDNAEEFKRRMIDVFIKLKRSDIMDVTIDSPRLDSDFYIDFVEDRYWCNN